MSEYLYISFGFVGGLAIGGFIGTHFYRRLDAKWSRLMAVHNLSNAYLNLEALRSEKVAHTIKMNELLLDAGIAGLGNRLRTIPPKRRSPDYVNWLRRAKEYRAKYPRPSGMPEVDSAIEQAFKLIE